MSRYKTFSAVPAFGIRFARWLLLPVLMVLAVACGTAPVQEMSEARQAIEAARVAGAEQHAGEQFERAQSLLKSAEQMLNDRRFRDARRSAAQARDEAIQAREATQQVLQP